MGRGVERAAQWASFKDCLIYDTKAEFAKEGTFFTNRFPSMRTFVNKKVGI